MQKQKKFLCASIANMIAFGFVCAVHIFGIKEKLLEMLGNANIPLYVLIVLVYILGYFIAWKLPVDWEQPWCNVINRFVLVFSSFLALISFNMEPRQLDAAMRLGFLFNYGVPVRTGIVIIAVALLFFSIWKLDMFEDNGKWSKWLYWCVVVILVVLCASYYMPNLADYYAVHHFHAYANSIYNVINGNPFEPGVYSIYGHYAFLYAPFVKLLLVLGFTNEVKIISMLATMLILISIVMFAYALDTFLENDVLKIITVLFGYTVMLKTDFAVYLQNFPHRLFPCILVLFVISLWYRIKNHRKVMMWIGYVICILQVIWNNEMGIVCIITWAAFNIIQILQRREIREYVKITFHILLIPACFGVAVVLTGLMNCTIGGGMISVREYLFPFGISHFMNEVLQYDLLLHPSGWMFMVAFLCCAVAMGVCSTRILTQEPRENDSEVAIFGIGVIGLGTLVYAMNRPAFGNFYFGMPVVGLCMAILIEKYYLRRSDDDNKIIHIFGVLLATTMLFVGLYNGCATVHTLNNRKELWGNNALAEEVSRTVQETYNDNTVGIGSSVAEVFAMSGLDTHYAVMDFSDFNISDVCISKSCEEFQKMDGKDVYITEGAMNWYGMYVPDYTNHFLETHTEKNIYSDGVQTIIYYVANE